MKRSYDYQRKSNYKPLKIAIQNDAIHSNSSSPVDSDKFTELEKRMAENDRKMAELNEREQRLRKETKMYDLDDEPVYSKPYETPYLNNFVPETEHLYDPFEYKESPAKLDYAPLSETYRGRSSERNRDRSRDPMLREKKDYSATRPVTARPVATRPAAYEPSGDLPKRKADRRSEESKYVEDTYTKPPSEDIIVLSDDNQEKNSNNLDHIEEAFRKHRAKRQHEPNDSEYETELTPKIMKDKISDYFIVQIRKAIAAGRIKMTENEIIQSGPNYSHTTNGRELEYQQCRIFVGHLPVDYLSKDDIYYMFEQYGKILAISLHKGCCFVQFKNTEMAQAAATAQNGRRVKNSGLEVNLATMTKEEARKLPREGATLNPILRLTPNCRLFLENDAQRIYATEIERMLRALGVTADTTIWKDTFRKTFRKTNMTIAQHMNFLNNDHDSICAIQLSKGDYERKTVTVHLFKNELEEHRNMPVIDAIILVANRVEKLRKLDEPPPGRIGSIMRIIADGRLANLLEVEQVIEWLEQKRLKLGGRKRTYQVDESTEKLKDTITQLFGNTGIINPSATLEMISRIDHTRDVTDIFTKAKSIVDAVNESKGKQFETIHGGFEPLPAGPPSRPIQTANSFYPPCIPPKKHESLYSSYAYSTAHQAPELAPKPVPAVAQQTFRREYGGGPHQNDYHPSGITYGQTRH